MRPFRAVLLLACLAGAHPAVADVPAPNAGETRPDTAPRRTGRMPAQFTVTPADAVRPPAHIVVTIPRERLAVIMASAGSDPLGDPAPAVEPLVTGSDRTRHYVAAAAVTLAVLSLPLLAGRFRRRRALVLALVAVLGGVSLVRADIAAPPGGPPTVEVIIVGGNGPVQVQLAYPPRR